MLVLLFCVITSTVVYDKRKVGAEENRRPISKTEVTIQVSRVLYLLLLIIQLILLSQQHFLTSI